MHDQPTAKACSRCGIVKPLSDFYPARGKRARRDGLQSYCKVCSREGSKQWRLANPGQSAAWQRRHRSLHVERYRGYETARYARSPAVQATLAARDTACVDCGVQLPPQVMELDHVRGEKAFTLGGPRLRDRDLDVVIAEIAKCDVRCPNCHRMRHYLERKREKAT